MDELLNKVIWTPSVTSSFRIACIFVSKLNRDDFFGSFESSWDLWSVMLLISALVILGFWLWSIETFLQLSDFTSFIPAFRKMLEQFREAKDPRRFDLHTRCLKQYRSTLGDSNHRIDVACHRLADDNLRFENYAEAQKLIAQAIKVFSERSRYRQGLSRSLYKAAQISRAMGNHTKAISELDEAYILRQMVTPDDTRTLDELGEVDFDNMVVFWSR